MVIPYKDSLLRKKTSDIDQQPVGLPAREVRANNLSDSNKSNLVHKNTLLTN